MTAMTLPAQPWVNGQTTADGTRYFDSSVGSTGAWRSTPLPVGGLPAGSIIQWSSNTAPANWLICDGSAVSRTVYSSLFAVIGTTYGTGDGSTTFNLPDLRGRVPVGKNAGTFSSLAGTGGEEAHTLTVNEMPSHNHGSTYSDGVTPKNSIWLGGGTSVGFGFTNTGGGQAHNNLQPYLVVNYIIKASAGWTAGDSELATRVGALETADATTNKSGLVPVIPSSVTLGSGTSSVSANGSITVTGASYVLLNNVFSTNYPNYRVIVSGYGSSTGSGGNWLRLWGSSGEQVTGYYESGDTRTFSGTGSNYSVNNGSSWDWSPAYTGAYSGAVMDILEPYISIGTKVISTATKGAGDTTRIAGLCDTGASYTSLKFFQGDGANITCRIQVYGYR